MPFENKPFDESFATVLERGWSLDFTNTIALWLLCGAVTGEVGVATALWQEVLDRGKPRALLEPAAKRHLGEALAMLMAQDHIQYEPRGEITFVICTATRLHEKAAEHIHRYASQQRKVTAAADMVLAHFWAHGTTVPPSEISLCDAVEYNDYREGHVSLDEERLNRLWRARHQVLCGDWRVVRPEYFREAEDYLWEAGLLSPRGLTAEGREVMEAHGGSTAAYRRHLREGKKMNGGDSYTTNITTGGGPAVIGNAGRMPDGEIKQIVTEKPIEFAADADAFAKIVAILKGLDGDEHDDDLHEAMTLKKAAEASGGELPDEDYKARAKSLWGRVAGAVGKAAPDVVAKTLAEFFTKMIGA